LPGYEHQVFVPNTTLFTRNLDRDEKVAASRHQLIHGTVRGLEPSSVRYSPFVPRHPTSSARTVNPTTSTGLDLIEGPEQTLEFDYCIYSLGAKYPSPINVWTHQRTILEHEPEEVIRHVEDALHGRAHEINQTPVIDQGGEGERRVRGQGGKKVVETTESTGTKREGMAWLKAAQDRINEADRILIVGGGALGVRKSLNRWLMERHYHSHDTLSSMCNRDGHRYYRDSRFYQTCHPLTFPHSTLESIRSVLTRSCVQEDAGDGDRGDTRIKGSTRVH
jgi:hypothetical protein